MIHEESECSNCVFIESFNDCDIYFCASHPDWVIRQEDIKGRCIVQIGEILDGVGMGSLFIDSFSVRLDMIAVSGWVKGYVRGLKVSYERGFVDKIDVDSC